MSDNENKNASDKPFIEETIKSKPINKKKFCMRLILALIIAAAAACVAAFVFVNMIPIAEKVSGRETVKDKIALIDETSGVPTVSPRPTKEVSAAPSSEAAGQTEEEKEKEKEQENQGAKSSGKSTEKNSGKTGESAEGSAASAEADKDGDSAEAGKGDDSTESGKGNASTESAEADGQSQSEKEEQIRKIVKEEISSKELTIDDYITLHEKMSEIAADVQAAVVSVTGITSTMDYFENTYENSQQLSGVIVANNGEEIYILTGYSVLEKVERIQVTFVDGYIADAYFVRHDPDTGLAVIKVNVSGIPEETLNAVKVASFSMRNNARPGDRVMAIGTLLGYNHSLTYGTVISTSGIYSASDCDYELISTDIGAGGSSSGVLLNLRGAITGVIIPADKRNGDHSLAAYTSEGIRDLIEKLSNNEARPYIGIHGMNVTDSIAERSGIAKGILITSIENDSPAMLAGIMDRDILVKIGDTSVMTMDEYAEALSGYEPGSDVHIVTMRMGNEGYTEMEFDVTVGEI